MLNTAQLRAAMEEDEIKNLGKEKKGGNKEFDNALEQNEELNEIKFHTIDLQALASDLETNLEKGMTEEKAKAKILIVGPNKLDEKTEYPWFVKLFLEMTGIFSCLLWAGALLCFIAYGLSPGDPSNVRNKIYVLAISWHCYLHHRDNLWKFYILPE
jgi:magnesium-transporting ATPase (P-type)